MPGEKINPHSIDSVSYFIVRDGHSVGRIEWFQDIGFQELIEKIQAIFRESPDGVQILKMKK